MNLSNAKSSEPLRAQNSVPPHLRELGGKLAGLTLPQQVFTLAVWPLAEQILNLTVNLVDIWVAGHLPGPHAVAATNAVGVGGYIEWLLSLMQMAMGIGAAAVISRAMGARHRRMANAALGQALLGAAIVGLSMGVLTYIFAPLIGSFAELTGESLAGCISYIRVLTIAAPLSAVLMVGNSAMRASGDTRTPFQVMVLVNIVNTAGTLLFTRGPGFIGGHGVAGIAAGTTAGWTAGVSLVLYTLLKNRNGLRLHLHRLKPHWHMLKRILRVGLPSLAESSGQWIGNFLVIKVVGHVGRIAAEAGLSAGAVGAHMITVRIEAISYLPGLAVGVAASTLVGQYLGLGDPTRARQAIVLCWKAAVTMMGVMGLILIIGAPLFTGLMTHDAEQAQMAVIPLRTAGVIQIFFATYLVLSQAMRGAGDTQAAMFMTYGSTFLVRLPAAYVLAIPMGLGLKGVWYALCGELALRGCLFYWRYRSGAWLKVKV